MLFLVGLCFPPSALAADDSDSAAYAEVLLRERELRAPGDHPPLNELRAVIAEYEAIVRRFPQSDFDDNALWQGAGLAIEAFDLYRQTHDLGTGQRLLRLLEANHPKSSLAPRVDERLHQLDTLGGVARLEEIRRESSPDGVRITIVVDREVTFAAERLTGPSRLFFDLDGTEASATLRNTTLAFEDDDIIREVRLGRHPNQVTRVVIDTEATESCHTFTLYQPFRLVVECQRGLRPPTILASTPPAAAPDDDLALDAPDNGHDVTPPVANADGVFSVARQLGLGVSRIVIDPGHGGHDPGASARGLGEAELVLDIALRLEGRLKSAQPGLEVVLTRREDQYVPLEALTTLANRLEADLFLSVHANASANTSARGVETYFLNFAADPEAESLAARENVVGLATMKQLDGLLEAIAANSKLDESHAFAQTVQTAILDTLRRVDPDVPDLGVKQSPFVVLIGARMPSILAEVSFLSNEQDAELLATESYRDLIADALFEGIMRYQRALGSDGLVAVADNNW
jgi:N-acetylmuramoyl-L-alanine amidase